MVEIFGFRARCFNRQLPISSKHDCKNIVHIKEMFFVLYYKVPLYGLFRNIFGSRVPIGNLVQY